MSEVDFESQVASEDEVVSGEKLVSVREAIRYRKRAQSAENEAVKLQKRLEESKTENEHLNRQLSQIELDRQLAQKLTVAGVHDIETAVLVAKARLSGGEDIETDSVIEQMRSEKSYLFEEPEGLVTAAKTAGVKDRKPGGRSVLERSAKRAAVSGSRADVQEYLRVRRKFV